MKFRWRAFGRFYGMESVDDFVQDALSNKKWVENYCRRSVDLAAKQQLFLNVVGEKYKL